MTPENALPCPGCGKPPVGEMVQIQPPDATLPPIALHEVCFLRASLAEAEQGKLQMIAVLSGILVKLGGTVRLHPKDVEQGMAIGGGTIHSRPEPGGFLLVSIGEEKRVVLAAPAEVPRSGPKLVT